MRRRKYTVTSDFYCTVCGTKAMMLPRVHGQQRENGHIKDIYCFKCGKVQKMKEVKQNQAYKTLAGNTV